MKKIDHDEDLLLTQEEIAFKLSSTYVYTGMFIVAGLLVSQGTFTIYQLAENVGQDTTDVGSIFVPYGVGLFVGLMSVKWKNIRLDILLSSSLLLSTIVLIILPFNRSKTMLYPYQFILGLQLAVIETGSMYQVRKIQQKAAGVWLGLTGSCLSVGFFLLPLVMAITKNNIYAEFFFVAACTAAAAILLLLKACKETQVAKARAADGEFRAIGLATHEATQNLKQRREDIELVPFSETTPMSAQAAAPSTQAAPLVSNNSKSNPHYRVEILLSFLFIIFVGMENSIGVFLQQYLDENPALDASRKNEYQMLFISTASASKLLVPAFQYFFSKPKQIRYFLYALNFLSFLGALIWVLWSPLGSGAVPATDYDSSAALTEQKLFWMFLAVNGLTTGGTMSLAYDVCNSLTTASRSGVMFLTGGIYVGSSFFTWVYSGIWNNKVGVRRHEVYPVMILSISLLVFLLFPVLPYISYVPAEVVDASESVPEGEGTAPAADDAVTVTLPVREE